MNNIALWRTPAVGYTKTVEIGVPLFAGESLSTPQSCLLRFSYETRLDSQRTLAGPYIIAPLIHLQFHPVGSP
jgi:hypothetical protein